MGFFDLLKKERSVIKCAQCFREVGETKYWKIDGKQYCQECYTKKISLKNQGGGNLSEHRDFKMPVEDVFFVKNRGVVLTGRISSGTVCFGDMVTVNDKEYKVIGIEMFRKLVNNAKEGDNIGLLIETFDPQNFKRDDIVSAPKKISETKDTFVCKKCKRELTIKYLHKNDICAECFAKGVNEKNGENAKDLPKLVRTDVKYLFDLSSLDKETLYDLQYMVGKKRVRYDEEMSVMYAGRCDDNSIYCVFLITAGTKITIYTNTLKDGIIELHPQDTFTVDMFYAYEKEEFLEKLCLKRVVPIRREEVRQAIWDALLIKFPDYNTKNSPRSSIFEKYFPFSLDNFVGAEKYSNSGILYKMLKPVSEDNEMMEFQKWNIFNMGTENESKCLQAYYCTCPYPQTEEEFLSEYEEVFAREELSVLEHIPHKIIYLDDQDSKKCGIMGF